MNELKNVHYTGTELLWLESGWPERKVCECNHVDGRCRNCTQYKSEMIEALSKAVRFEDIERVGTWAAMGLTDWRNTLRAGESYYLDPKLVKVYSECSCMIRPQFCFASCGKDQTVFARIIEPREEQKPELVFLSGDQFNSPQNQNRDSAIVGFVKVEEQKESQEDLIEEIYHLCNTEPYEHVAKLYTITRNPVTK